MFPHGRTSKLAQRALGALMLARSFLLLEDDHEVDWEVGQVERGHASHPHRAPLRGGLARRRRPGQLPAAVQVCLSPVGRAAPAQHRARARGLAAGASHSSGAGHGTVAACERSRMPLEG
jgi:hypothetical protein